MKIKIITLLLSATISTFLIGCAQTIEEKQLVEDDKRITIKLEAVVSPSVNSKIISPYDGKIETIFVKNGDRVKKGEAICRFNLKDETLKIKNIKREIKIIKQQIFRNSENREVNIYNNNADILKNSELYLEKITTLYAEGYATESELSSARKEYLNLKKEYENVKKENSNRFNDFKISKDQNLILLNQKELELANAKHQIENATVISDFDGYLIDALITEGSNVAKGSKIGSIVNIDNVMLKAGLAPGLYQYIKKGDVVKVDFIVTPPYSVEANITRIIPIVDPVFGRMIVEIELENSNFILQDGMKAMVEIDLKKEYQAKVKKYFIDKEKETVVNVGSDVTSKGY